MSVSVIVPLIEAIVVDAEVDLNAKSKALCRLLTSLSGS